MNGKPNSVLIFVAICALMAFGFSTWAWSQRDLAARNTNLEAKTPKRTNVPRRTDETSSLTGIKAVEFCYEGLIYVWFPTLGVSPKIVPNGNSVRAEACPED